jgi:putative endonuclease
MKTIGTHNYFVYITTNKLKTVLYTGVTNNLSRRIYEHKEMAYGDKDSFAGKYNAFYLIYWEWFKYPNHAIKREKQIKGWRRDKKEKMISDFNPEWRFLNDEIE